MKFFSYADADEQLTDAPRETRLRPTLREFSDAELDVLDSFVANLRFASGACIVANGERSDALLLIVSGSVRLSAGAGEDERELDRLGEGEAFGIACFLDGGPSAITAVALEATEVLALRRDALAQLAAWKPGLAMALLQDLAAYTSRRLRQLDAAC